MISVVHSVPTEQELGGRPCEQILARGAEQVGHLGVAEGLDFVAGEALVGHSASNLFFQSTIVVVVALKASRSLTTTRSRASRPERVMLRIAIVAREGTALYGVVRQVCAMSRDQAVVMEQVRKDIIKDVPEGTRVAVQQVNDF